MNQDNSKKIMLFVIIILFVLLICAGIYIYYLSMEDKSERTEPATTARTSEPTTLAIEHLVDEDSIKESLDKWIQKYLGEGYIGSYKFEVKMLDKQDYCENISDSFIQVGATIYYERLKDFECTEFSLTGNDEEDSKYDEYNYAASAGFVLEKSGENEYTVASLYTGC